MPWQPERRHRIPHRDAAITVSKLSLTPDDVTGTNNKETVMRKVERFISDDGLEFTSAAACIGYEALCKEVGEIMAKLPAIPNLPGCGFANGDGYLQHDPAPARAARVALLRIANTIMPHEWFKQSIEDDTMHPSWAGRLIGEMSQKCVWQAWRRFECMTGDWREYGQPYYANNPGAAKDVRLNPK